MRDAPHNKSFNAGDKLELMSRISEKIDMRRKLNETYDDRVKHEETKMPAKPGSRYGRRGTSGVTNKTEEAGGVKSKKRRESAKAYPWEIRETSLRQQQQMDH